MSNTELAEARTVDEAMEHNLRLSWRAARGNGLSTTEAINVCLVALLRVRDLLEESGTEEGTDASELLVITLEERAMAQRLANWRTTAIAGDPSEGHESCQSPVLSPARQRAVPLPPTT